MTIENNAGIAPVRAAAPPRLVIDARTSTTDGIDPGYRLLGLALVERIALAARHCGFGSIYVLTRDGGNERLRRLLARVDGANVGASFPEDGEAEAHTVGVNGLILGERNWLEAAAGAAPPDHGIFTLGTGAVIGGRKVTLARVAAALSGSTPSKTFTLPAEAPLIIRFEADLAAAEKRLLRSLGKASEGFMERRFERPISVRISRVLASTPVTPNQVTLLAAATGLLAAPFFLSAAPLWQSCGALLFVAHAILDSCDGPLARLRFEVSRRGGLLDFWCDNAVHMVIFGCMAAGWSREIGAGWPLALGASAILGTLGSASFVFWRVMRPKRREGLLYDSVAKGAGNRLTALLDALSRRDFIYLVLIFSLPGEAAWFLALAAVGAPIFFVMLLVAAAQERRRN